jgi:hypothetical protein
MRKNKEITIKKVQDPSASPELLLKAMDSKFEGVRYFAARNANATPEILLRAIDDSFSQKRFSKDMEYHYEILRHRNANDAVFIKVMERSAAMEGAYSTEHVLYAIGDNANASTNILLKIMEQCSVQFRENKRLKAKAHHDYFLKEACTRVINNPACTPSILLKYFLLEIEKTIEDRDPLFQIAFTVAIQKHFSPSEPVLA